MTKKQIKDLKWAHLCRNTISSEEEFYIKAGGGKVYSEAEVRAMKEDADERQLTKDRESQLLWLEEEKKRIAWREAHWVCLEGGEGYYDFKK